MAVASPAARPEPKRPLVLGLGNDLIADDGFGILAVEELQVALGDRAEFVGTSVHGVALLDSLIGYDQVIVIDVIQTGQNPVGTVTEIDPRSFRPVASPSPHYTGLPEMLALAEQLELPFPKDIRVFAVEAQDLVTLGGPMTAAVREALPEVIRRVRIALDEFAPSPKAG